MAWTVATLRDYRQYPQSDAVLQRSLDLASADIERVNPDADEDRKDRVAETLVRIDLQSPPDRSANQLESERARVLQTLIPSIYIIQDSREVNIYPVRYWV